MSTDGFDNIAVETKEYQQSASSLPQAIQTSDWNEKEKNQTYKFRETLVKFVLRITSCWLIGLAFIFYFTGESNLILGRPFMADSVLIALIGGTSFLGLIAIILKSLFNKGDMKDALLEHYLQQKNTSEMRKK